MHSFNFGNRAIDLTGKKFGKLKVITSERREGDRQLYWRCSCDCGGEVILRSDVLRKQHRKDCGCKNRVDLLGQKFGKLTVESEARVGRRQVRFWKCKCECGSIVERNLSTRELQHGEISSCGCSVGRQGADHPSFSGYRDISGGMWNRIKVLASMRGLSFSLSIEDAWVLFEKQGRKCAMSGAPLTMGRQSRKNPIRRTASLDRIDSSRGYSLDNVQWVHVAVNMMKRDLSVSEFVQWCRLVSNNVDCTWSGCN